MTAPATGDPREVIAALLGGDDFGNLETTANPPVHWPALDGDEYADELRGLYEWATRLQQRYPEMIRLPACWYRHNGLIELLGALRDHERASYSDTSAPTAAVSWHIAFRDVEARLRTWVAELRCGGERNYHDTAIHTPTTPDLTPPGDLDNWIAAVRRIRTDDAIRAAVAGETPAG